MYAHDGANMLTGAARFARPLVYVPNSQSDTVDVIDPRRSGSSEHFAVGGLPQHVVPAWNLRTLYVTNDIGNSLTPIDPRTGKPGARDPGRRPVQHVLHARRPLRDRRRRAAPTDSTSATRHSFRLHHSLAVPCAGVDHMDFTRRRALPARELRVLRAR